MNRFVILSTALLLSAQGLSAQPTPTEPIPLADGTELSRHIERRHLGPDLVHTEVFQIRVPAGHRGLILAEQRAADVVIEAHGKTLGTPWRVDSPLDFDGTEVLLLPLSAYGNFELRVEARLPGGPDADLELDSASATAPSSRLTLSFEIIPQSNAHRRRLELLGNLTAAGRAWAQGDGEGRNRALEFYGRAARSSADLPSADLDERSEHLGTQAAYAQVVLFRLLGRHQDARDHAEKVLDAWQRLGDRKRLADTWNEIGLVSGPAGRTDEARRAFERAIELAEQLDDPFRLAYLRGNLCLVDLMENQLRRGVDCYAAALPTVRRVGDFETESAYLLNMAQAQRRLGELDDARKLYGRALEIQTNAGLKKLEAKTLNNLAGLHLDRGDLEAALDAFRRAAAGFEQLADLRWLGRSLHNLGATYLQLGDTPSARDNLEEALAVHRKVGDLNGEANVLRIFGHLEARQGNLIAARRAYTSSRDLERQTRNSFDEAVADAYIARIQIQEGEPEAARARLQRSLDVLKPKGWNAKSARVLVDLGRSLIQLGRENEAHKVLREALEVFRDLDDPRGQGFTLLYLAELAEFRLAADPQTAQASKAEVLDLLRTASEAFDTVTLKLNDPDLRAFFAGSQRQARERYASGLIKAGRSAEALQVSEAARAWGLRAVLATTSGLIRSNQALLPSPAGNLSAPTLQQIRAELDNDTILLHFLVGERVSHLFVVGPAHFETHELPPREELEKAVRRARAELVSMGSNPQPMAGLTQLLLDPVWNTLDQPKIQRLVLALDGPLHYLPFAALPLPKPDSGSASKGEARLVSRFEIARIPSVAVLSLERRRRSLQPPAQAYAAVFADPVFAAHDLRLPRPPAQGRGSEDETNLYRLRWSHREAKAVMKASQGKPTLIAQGTDAHRDLLLSEPLDRYQILHLATHARVDPTVASRSGLELSAFDAQGSPRQGFVSLSTLRRLQLQADLVVLSACRTALGTEIRGEGLVGLVQTFLEAGAGRVIASLWSVPDRSTAELMENFYAGLTQNAAPVTALRRAQLQVLAEDPARHPSAWAGFVLVGDWR